METNQGQPPVNSQEGTSNEPKTYTQAEMDELLQRETDRRVTSALQTREAKLRDDIKREAELEYARKSGDKESELAQLRTRLAEIERDRLDAQTSAIFSEMGISDIAPAIKTDMSTLEGRRAFAEAIKRRDDARNAEVAKLVQVEVEKRLTNSAPPKINTATTATDPATARKELLEQIKQGKVKVTR